MKISTKLNLLGVFLIAGFILLLIVSVFSMNSIFSSLKDIDQSYRYLAALNECDFLLLGQMLESHRILLAGGQSISEDLLISIRLKDSELNKKIRELKLLTVPVIIDQQDDLINEFTGLYDYINKALIKRIFNNEDFSASGTSAEIMSEYSELQKKLRGYEAYVDETLKGIIMTGNGMIFRFNIFFIGICAAMISALVLNLTFIRRTVLSTISQISAEMLKLTEGEARLDFRFNLVRKDEIGELAAGFNTFLGNMEEMMLHITDAGNLSAGLGVKIEDGIQKNSCITGHIKGNVNQLQAYFTELAFTIKNINSITSSIFSGTGASQSLTEQQISILRSTEASVKRTVDEISALREMGNINIENTGRLIAAAEEGLSSVSSLDGRIEELFISANDLGGITETINNISANIKTLGINAAIEAARAGRAGCGFKVVAGEIVSLGEMVNMNAVRIEKTLTAVLSSIDELRSESERGKLNFRLIETNADEVFKSIKELGLRLHEHEKTEKEWIENLSTLSSSSASVFEQLESLGGDAAVISESVNRLDSEFNSAHASLENVEAEAERLLELTTGLELTGSENNSVAEKLRSYTSHFNS